MTSVETETVKAAVRETYGRIASEQRTSGCCGSSDCCGPGVQPNSSALGYSEDERQSAPKDRTSVWVAGIRRQSPNCSPGSESWTSEAAPDSMRSSRRGRSGPQVQ